jgi:hypothetical protein
MVKDYLIGTTRCTFPSSQRPSGEWFTINKGRGKREKGSRTQSEWPPLLYPLWLRGRRNDEVYVSFTTFGRSYTETIKNRLGMCDVRRFEPKDMQNFVREWVRICKDTQAHISTHTHTNTRTYAHTCTNPPLLTHTVLRIH